MRDLGCIATVDKKVFDRRRHEVCIFHERWADLSAEFLRGISPLGPTTSTLWTARACV